MLKNHKAKKDRYYKSRGSTTQFYDLFCGQCNTHIALYQKDGQGSLLRLYLDRIVEPESIAELNEIKDKSKLPPLKCPKCGKLIGIPMIYESENRLAFRLFRGSLQKKRSNGDYFMQE